jgi:hypothetical protein
MPFQRYPKRRSYEAQPQFAKARRKSAIPLNSDSPVGVSRRSCQQVKNAVRIQTLTTGNHPLAGLIFDQAGNLYSTTANGGLGCAYGYGLVFELTPNSNGGWSETVLQDFCRIQGQLTALCKGKL